MTPAAYEFERTKRLHETRRIAGIVNRLTPPLWRIYHDDRINQKTIEIVEPLIRDFQRPVILAIGAGGGGLLRRIWNEAGVMRIGIDINHDVLVDEGKQYFRPVEGSAHALPIRDESADIVLFDYVLHHLVAQGGIEPALREGMRVLRQEGYVIAREPSVFSLGGLTLNLANRFHLMHALTGASNYEFAVSPPHLLRLFQREGTVLRVCGLSYLLSRRLPIWLQATIGKLEPYVWHSQRGQWTADYVLYVVRKNRQMRCGGSS